MRIWGLITLLILFGISMAGMAWESKAQIILLILLIAAMVNFFVGTFIRTDAKTAEGFYGYNGMEIRIGNHNNINSVHYYMRFLKT